MLKTLKEAVRNVNYNRVWVQKCVECVENFFSPQSKAVCVLTAWKIENVT